MPRQDSQFLEINPRYWAQNANLAVRNVYDALIELITNPDDRYVVLGQKHGKIEIEVDRRRKGTPSIIRVRDFADGMTLEAMRNNLAKVGQRVSGLEAGKPVRGTNSRGAKDVAILGGVEFESIAKDGRYHHCEITAQGKFIPHDSVSQDAPRVRKQMGLLQGTGTVVTLTVDPEKAAVPQHDTLKKELGRLVALRDILSSPEREIVLLDSRQGRQDVVRAPVIEGRERLSEAFEIPGYPKARAKLVIKRAREPLEDQRPQFRLGGILVKSKHAIHDATLFAPELEHDPHAQRFFGKLTCEFIDELWNEYDDRFDRGLKPTGENPCPLIDPLRKYGLVRDHPFVDRLYKEALKRLRPLVEEERTQAEESKKTIESEGTRRRLRALEREAAKFISENRESEEPPRDPETESPDSVLARKGYSLNPPYTKLLAGHSTKFWLTVLQSSFPELSVSDTVVISCSGREIEASKRICGLEAHPKREGVLRAVWTISAVTPTKAVAVKVQVGPILDESAVEVIASERERYEHVKDLTFNNKRYSVPVGEKRTIFVLAPFPSVVSERTELSVLCDDKSFQFHGPRTLEPRTDIGVAICRFRVSCAIAMRKATLVAVLGDRECKAAIESVEPLGGSIKIEFSHGDYGNQRSYWRGSTLYIAAKHNSIARYLGPPPKYLGQEEKHFRLLLAEIVADAVCQRLMSRNVTDHPQEFADWDWDAYYAEYTRLMTRFLPMAHETQLKSE